MKLIKAFLLLLITTGTALLSHAQAPDGFSPITDTQPVKESILKASDETWSVSFDFEQEKHLTMMEELITSKGKFLFKKENNVRWEYLEPISYVILISNNRFVINNDGKVSSFETDGNKMFQEINEMIVMAISGSFVDNPDFSAGFYRKGQKVLVILKPNKQLVSEILSSIQIEFSEPDMMVEQVRFIEPGDDFTVIRFINRQSNVNIADSEFEL